MATADPVHDSSRGTLAAQREHLRRVVEGAGADAIGPLRALLALDRERLGQDERARQARLEMRMRVQDSMERLRACETPKALIEATPREACLACGFSRAMLSEVRGSLWVPSAIETAVGGWHGEESLREYLATARFPLDHLLLETEMVRRRVPVLVGDASSDRRTNRVLVRRAHLTSYVAAPIMPTRRVIGFLHADRFGQDRPCDAADRDALWHFAEHFGLLFERSVLLETLEAQRVRVQRTLRGAAAQIDEVCRTNVTLVRRGPIATAPRVPRRRDGLSRLDTLLTPREREVLELLAAGASNAETAERLVISKGTVKSHVKRIHRKLRVSDRAAAVSTYLRILRLDESGR